MQLEGLWLNANALSSAEQLAPLAPLERLQTLRLAGCPLAATADYRERVRAAVHEGLVQLDADPVRRCAA